MLVQTRELNEQLTSAGLIKIWTVEDTDPVSLKGERRVLCTTAAVNGVLLLPPASVSMDRMIYIMTTISAGGKVTLQDAAGNGGAAGTELSQACVMDTTGDYVVVWCDGVVWHVIVNGIAQ